MSPTRPARTYLHADTGLCTSFYSGSFAEEVSQNINYHQSKQGCKDQESIQSSTTPDPGYQWESDKLTVDTTNESQEVSPFPAGDHKAHINRRAQNIANTRQNKNIKDSQKKYRIGTVSFFYRDIKYS